MVPRIATPEEQATYRAMWAGILLVILPGMIFVVGLIALLKPALPSPAIITGCFQGADTPVLHLSPTSLTIEQPDQIPRTVAVTKSGGGYVVYFKPGVSFRQTAGGNWEAVYLSKSSQPVSIRIENNHPFFEMDGDGHALYFGKVPCRPQDR